jgi:hypothetical protein
MRQEHSPEDDVAHGRFLAQAFADPRYIRQHGRPLFVVWRPKHLPDPRATINASQIQSSARVSRARSSWGWILTVPCGLS